jgi:MFS transporter, DHA1 family, multidrug resistance protein
LGVAWGESVRAGGQRRREDRLGGLGWWSRRGGRHGPGRTEEGSHATGSVPALLLTTGLVYTAWDLVTPFIPLFVLELEGGDPRSVAGWSGLLVGISPLLSALAGPFWGAFAERFGGRQALLRTILTSTVLIALTAFVTSVWHLLVLRVLVGLLGGFFVLIHTLAAQATTRERVGQTIGALQAIQMSCLAVIPPFAGLLADRWGLRSNFLLAAGIMILGFVVMWRGYRPPPSAPAAEGHPAHKGRASYWGLLASPELAIVAAVIFSAQFVDRLFNAMAPLLVVELAPDSDQIGFITGLILGLGSGSTAIAALVSGRLARRLSARRLLLGSLAGGCLVLPLLAAAGAVWQLVALRIALGLLAGGTITLAYAFVSTFLPAERLGATFSMFASCAMLGASVGPMSLGAIAAVSLRLPLVVGAAALALCLLLLLRFPRLSLPAAPSPAPGRSPGMGDSHH